MFPPHSADAREADTMTETAGEPSDFEVIRDGLLRLDPETRHHVIEAMRVLRDAPLPVGVRVLAGAAATAGDAKLRLILPG